MDDVQRQEGKPFNRLTEISEDMLDAIAHHKNVKAIVMLTEGEDNGIGLSGWEDDAEAIAYIFIHLQAIMRANGKELRVMTEDGVFIDE